MTIFFYGNFQSRGLRIRLTRSCSLLVIVGTFGRVSFFSTVVDLFKSERNLSVLCIDAVLRDRKLREETKFFFSWVNRSITGNYLGNLDGPCFIRGTFNGIEYHFRIPRTVYFHRATLKSPLCNLQRNHRVGIISRSFTTASRPP